MLDLDYEAPPGEFRLKRFTIPEYERLIGIGGIPETDPVELLDGWVVQKMPHNAPHDSSVSRLNRRLGRVLGEKWIVRIQSSVRLDHSIPEPDLAVVFGPEDRFDVDRPGPGEIELVVEVSAASLAHDRGFKHSLYARNGIPVYWVVNLIDRQIEVYTKPKGNKYAKRTDYKPGDDVPVTVAGKKRGTVAVSDVIPESSE